MTGRLLFIYIVATYMCLPIRAAGCTMVVDSLVINDSVSVSEVTVTARRAEFKWDKNVLVANVQDTDLKNELSGISLFKVTPVGKAPLSIQQTSALKEFSRDIEVLRADLRRHIHAAYTLYRLVNPLLF